MGTPVFFRAEVAARSWVPAMRRTSMASGVVPAVVSRVFQASVARVV